MNTKSIIIFGSSRRYGYTGQLVDEVARRHDLRIIDVSDYNMTPYSYDHNNRDDDFLPLMHEIAEYDQMILASPVYWYTMSAQLKVFIDRWNDMLHIAKDLGRSLKGKSGLVIGTGGEEVPERSFEECFHNCYKFMSITYDGMLYRCTHPDGLDLTAADEAIADFGRKILS